jgi:putative aldouronate transport system permease protein
MILGGILLDMLAVRGLVNDALVNVGLPRIPFLSSPALFQPTMILTDVFKNFGYGAIIYLAALTSIDPNLYEAAAVDGANRRQLLRHITLPGISSTIVLLATLSLGSVLNAGFEQVLVMYNPLVLSTGDIIDTYVYRVGLLGAKYGIGTAMGLLKGLVSLVLITLSYYLAERLANYRIF